MIQQSSYSNSHHLYVLQAQLTYQYTKLIDKEADMQRRADRIIKTSQQEQPQLSKKLHCRPPQETQ